MSSDATTASSAERSPPLIACGRSFAVGFDPVVSILLLLASLVLIVVFASMMMVIDNRIGKRQSVANLLRCCGHVTTTNNMQGASNTVVRQAYESISLRFLGCPDPILPSTAIFPLKSRICTMQYSMYPN